MVGATERVLLMDSDPAERSEVDKWLRSGGWEAWTCENPGEAISMLRSTDYDILITEIIFTGAEGFPFVDWVLANCPGIFIVVVTNAPFSWISRLGFMRHVQFCLERPLKRDALEKALRGLKTWNHD